MKKLVLLAAVAISLSACATASKPEAMSVSAANINPVASTSQLYNAVSIAEVDGGKKTNPLWTSQVSSEDFATALKDTLSANAMLATDTADYALKAQLVSMDQPFAGIDMTVTAGVTYTLTNVATGDVIYEKTIQTPYTAKMSDALVGMTRLRLANEGAVRENLQQMIKEITDKVDSMGAPMASARLLFVPA